MNDVSQSPRELLDALAAQGVQVSVERGRIRLKGPQALLGEAFSRLNDQRDAVISLLSENDEPSSDTPAQLEGPPGCAELPFLHLGEALAHASAGERGVVLFESGAAQRLAWSQLMRESLALLAQWQDQGVRPGDPVLLTLGQMRSGLVCLWAAVLGDLLVVPVAMGGGSHDDEAGARLWKSLDEVRRSVWWVADHVSMKTAQFPIGRALASEVSDAPGAPAEWRPASQDSRRPAMLVPGDDGRWVVMSHRDLLGRVAAVSSALHCDGSDSLFNAVALHRPGALLHVHFVAVALGLEFYQADEALVAADGLHFLRLIDDLAVSVAWAPADLWQRWSGALAGATEAQRDELSLALVRCLVLDRGAGGPLPATLVDSLHAIGLEATALRPGLGMGASLGLLLPGNAGDRQEPLLAAPVAGCAARIVAPDGSLVQWGRRGLLQWRSPLATRGDWLDAWRPVGWQNTGHVAIIDARGVSVLAWQGTLAPVVTAVTEVEPISVVVENESVVQTVNETVTPEAVETISTHQTTEAPAIVELSVTVETPVVPATPAIPATPVQCPLPLDAEPLLASADPLPAEPESSSVLATGAEPEPEPTIEPAAIPPVTPDEGHTSGGVDVLSGQSVRLAPGQGLYARLQVLARQRPRDVAILQDTQFVRYHGLVQQIEQWAASLRNVGLQVTDRILLAMPRGAEAVASLFALWRIGAVVVPVDTEEDDAFVAAVIQSVKPRLLLCHDTLMHGETGARWARLAEGHCPRLGLKELPPAPHLRDETAPRPDTLACIFHHRYGDAIHGACYTHGDLLVQFQALSAVLNLRANARWLATSHPGSTRGLLESLMPLLAGATLVVPAGTVLTAERLLPPLREQAVTHVLLGADWLREVLEAGALGRGVTVLAVGVRDPDVCVGVVRAGARGLALTLLPDVALCAAVAPLTPAGAEQGVVGEPLLNLGFALLSPEGEAVAAPGRGEWIVRGDGVSQGFWHDDGYQASRYVTLQGERYLRTGVEVVAGSLPFDSALVLRVV